MKINQWKEIRNSIKAEILEREAQMKEMKPLKTISITFDKSNSRTRKHRTNKNLNFKIRFKTWKKKLFKKRTGLFKEKLGPRIDQLTVSFNTIFNLILA